MDKRRRGRVGVGGEVWVCVEVNELTTWTGPPLLLCPVQRVLGLAT